jgi:hypothetical protein
VIADGQTADGQTAGLPGAGGQRPAPAAGPFAARVAVRAGPGGLIVIGMPDYWSIEVFDAEIPASQWRQAYSAALIEAAIAHGASGWAWLASRWGVVLEVCFADEAQWEAFRGLPAVRAALDSVPDPVNGLLVYRGRGGASGASSPRHPRPVPSAGAVALPEPAADAYLDVTNAQMPDPAGDLIPAV